MCADTALSRLTFEPSDRSPRFVRRSVSGATPTLNVLLSNSVTVRHVPLTLMLSPSWQSSKIASAPEIVSDVPPPPLAVVSSWSSLETAAAVQYMVGGTRQTASSLPTISTIPVNILKCIPRW